MFQAGWKRSEWYTSLQIAKVFLPMGYIRIRKLGPWILHRQISAPKFQYQFSETLVFMYYWILMLRIPRIIISFLYSKIHTFKIWENSIVQYYNLCKFSPCGCMRIRKLGPWILHKQISTPKFQYQFSETLVLCIIEI